MSMFIERHGYVKYPLIRYTATGPCEVPGCPELLSRLIHLSFDSTFNRTARGRRQYVVEHCHKHGWIRGITCQSCNVAISYFFENAASYSMLTPAHDYDAMTHKESLAAWYGVPIQRPDYETYLLNCPECAGKSAPQPSYIEAGYTSPVEPETDFDRIKRAYDEGYTRVLRKAWYSYQTRLGELESCHQRNLGSIQEQFLKDVRPTAQSKRLTTEENERRRFARTAVYEARAKAYGEANSEYDRNKRQAEDQFKEIIRQLREGYIQAVDNLRIQVA